MENREVFIALIKFVLDGQKEESYDCDWEALYRISRFHKLSPMIYEAVTALMLPVPEDVKKKFQEEYYKALSREVVFQAEYERMESCFTKAQIPFIPLKGILIKGYYPMEWMRTRSDTDILIHDKDAERVKAVMEDMGYNAEHYNQSNHDVYYLEPVVNVEIHRNLFPAEIFENWFHFFENVEKMTWERHKDSIVCPFSKEDHFLYLLTHLAKHMGRAGSGVRSILDIWLFWQAEAEHLNMEYVEKSLETLGLTVFCSRVKDLGDYWFGDAEGTEEIKTMADMVLQNGVYGKNSNLQLNMLSENGNGKENESIHMRKFKVIWSLFFPSVEGLKEAYPLLKKYPIILPAIQIFRVGKFVFNPEKRKPVTELAKKNEEDVQQYFDYLEIMGLGGKKLKKPVDKS